MAFKVSGTQILGHEIAYERRRYSNCTFTWAYAKIGGKWVLLGDPWPCINPPRKQMEGEIQRTTAATAIPTTWAS